MIPESIICGALGLYTLFIELLGNDISIKAYAIIEHDRVLLREQQKIDIEKSK